MKERTLYEVLQTAQYSRTMAEIAQKLYYSQPYLSKLMKEAETKYHTTLISRNKIPITLTTAGKTVLDHLKIIIEIQDDLNDSLEDISKKQQINILITNPFLYSMTNKILIPYMASHPNLTFKISTSPLNQGIKILKRSNFDIMIGRKYIDEQIQTFSLPENKVYFFVSKACSIFDPTKKILPFKPDYFKTMKTSIFISFHDSEGIQKYILRRFNEKGIQIDKMVEVDSVEQACIMAKELGLDNSYALINKFIAEQIFGDGKYNLIELPDNMLHLENAIMYHENCSDQIKNLFDYLRTEFSNYL